MADNERWRNNQDYADREYDRSRGRYAGGREDRSGGREGYRGGGRDFGDRASDEVRSWFGDDDAQRRRQDDERRSGYERGFGSGSRSSSGDSNRGDYDRGSYRGDQNRDYGQGGSGYGRGRYGGQGDYGSYGRRDYGGQGRGVTGYCGERGCWDRASDEVSSWFGDEEADFSSLGQALAYLTERGEAPGPALNQLMAKVQELAQT